MTEQPSKPEQTHPPSTTIPTLIAKLARVMAASDRVAKAGKNQSQGYNYATEADMVEAVRNELAVQGVMILPTTEELKFEQVATRSGGSMTLCTAKMKYTVTDGTEERVLIIYGQGTDSGDKALYKAMTGAEKYMVKNLFLLPTGDDPEKDHDKPALPPKQAPKAAATTKNDRPPVQGGEAPKPEGDLSIEIANAKTLAEMGAFASKIGKVPKAQQAALIAQYTAKLDEMKKSAPREPGSDDA